MKRLNLTVSYNIGSDSFDIDSDIKPEMRAEVIEAFIRSQAGAGVDESPPIQRKLYTIKLQLDVSDDTFYVEHDCGNKGLREGILMRVLNNLS